MAALPDEVLERLSVHGPVKLQVGGEGAVTVSTPIAPLDRQLFLFVQQGGAIEQSLTRETRASFVAEDPAGEYLIRATGRVVPGRMVTAESRRPELMHWLPAGASPADLVAVRFHPETIDYVQGRGATRTRAHGAVPGGAPPPFFGRWARLATDGVIGWVLAMAVLDWLGLLFLVQEDRRSLFLLALITGAGAGMLCGVVLLDRAARFVRWREGLETDAVAGLMLEGWDPPGHVRDVGFGMMAAGGVLAGLLAAAAGWKVGALTVATSGVLLLGPFYGVRHALRRRDAEREVG
jgi:hypothetical protein